MTNMLGHMFTTRLRTLKKQVRERERERERERDGGRRGVMRKKKRWLTFHRLLGAYYGSHLHGDTLYS
jgi:hypothetical protein